MNCVATPVVLGLALGLCLMLIENSSSFSLLNQTKYAPPSLFGRGTFGSASSVPTTRFLYTTIMTTTSGLKDSVSTHKSNITTRSPKHVIKTTPFDHIMSLLTNLTHEERIEYYSNCVSDGKPCNVAENCCSKKCLYAAKKCLSNKLAPSYYSLTATSNPA